MFLGYVIPPTRRWEGFQWKSNEFFDWNLVIEKNVPKGLRLFEPGGSVNHLYKSKWVSILYGL